MFQDIEAQYASSAESSDYDDVEADAELPLEENIETVNKESEHVKKGEDDERQNIETEANLVVDDDSDEYDEELLDLYCPACKKNFKTVKS